MSVVYIDTSAALKRPVLEFESGAIREEFRRHRHDGDLVVASSLVWLEAWRTLRRLGFDDVSTGVRKAMSGIEEVFLDQDVLRRARRVGTGSLRSLDAIHLASAVAVGADSMMTYDDRLASAVRSAGITVVRPVA